MTADGGADGTPSTDFEGMVADALAQIPEPFASQLASVAIVIDDESPPGPLFGLYQGVPRTLYGAESAPVPSKITIFRRTLAWVHRDAASLARAVEETVVHEVAHHFGISDERLRELQRGPKR